MVLCKNINRKLDGVRISGPGWQRNKEEKGETQKEKA